MAASRSAAFATTHWSLVLAAAERAGPEAEAALASLCQTYWPAVYTFIKRQTADLHQAQDWTQAFFARLLEQNLAAKAKRSRGRFRSFLLASVRNFLHNERDKARTLRRGGKPPLALDFAIEDSKHSHEPAVAMTPERLFERQWALALLDSVMARLRAEYAKAGKEAFFESVKESLAGAEIPLAAMAEQFDMTANAAKVAAHRLRKRYRELLRLAVAQTLADPSELDDEIRQLFASLQS